MNSPVKSPKTLQPFEGVETALIPPKWFDPEFFLSQTVKNGDCMEYRIGLDRDGYPQIKLMQKKNVRATRWILHLLGRLNILDRKMHALHHCDNRCCINPEHLFVGTHNDNMQDRKRKGGYR